ncbi:MAG: hypothetical protein Q4D56_06305 [Bacteroides sp.]|nr:hypothetical protein [Bacteroides sp.]
MEDINKISRTVTVFALGFIAFFALLGWAGSMEYTEQVLYTMPQEAYEAIYLKLGDGCSDRAIVKEYMDHKKYYDSLSE